MAPHIKHYRSLIQDLKFYMCVIFLLFHLQFIMKGILKSFNMFLAYK